MSTPSERSHEHSEAGFLVSHALKDKWWAEWIAWYLENADHPVLVQAWDGVPGTQWLSLVAERLGDGYRTLAVISEDYLSSAMAQVEWQAAFFGDIGSHARGLVPVRVKDCPLPRLLRGMLPLDLFDLSEEDARAGLDRLMVGLSGGRNQPDEARGYPGPDRSGAWGRSNLEQWIAGNDDADGVPGRRSMNITAKIVQIGSSNEANYYGR